MFSKFGGGAPVKTSKNALKYIPAKLVFSNSGGWAGPSVKSLGLMPLSPAISPDRNMLVVIELGSSSLSSAPLIYILQHLFLCHRLENNPLL